MTFDLPTLVLFLNTLSDLLITTIFTILLMYFVLGVLERKKITNFLGEINISLVIVVIFIMGIQNILSSVL